MTDGISEALSVLEKSGQPDVTFRTVEALTASLVGHQLFTLLYVDGDEVARVYSSRPLEYPLSGRKPMGPTPWGTRVLKGCKTYLGRDRQAIRWAFFDHALIESMGLGSVIDVPVVYDGNCIGTMNLLHTEFYYREEHVQPVAQLAPLLIPAFMDARRAG